MLIPDRPWCVSGIPECFKNVFLFQRIHAGPESVVPVSHQLAIFCEALNRALLPNRFISLDVIKGLTVQNKVTSIDPAFTRLRFLIKLSYLLPGKANASEARG